MKKTLKFCFLVAVICIIALTACKQDPKPEPEKEYKIGDVGPAGGIIFYDKGSKSDGWRYLEAAPADLRVVGGNPTVDKAAEGYDDADASYVFGYYRKTDEGDNLFVNGTTEYDEKNCTGTATGTGKKNTDLLVKAMGNSAYKEGGGEEKAEEYAAKLCSDLVFNEFDDWFMPSMDELKLMYDNLYKHDLGDFTKIFYWSSSEYSNDAIYARGLDFFNGAPDYVMRDYDLPHLRPARAF